MDIRKEHEQFLREFVNAAIGGLYVGSEKYVKKYDVELNDDSDEDYTAFLFEFDRINDGKRTICLQTDGVFVQMLVQDDCIDIDECDLKEAVLMVF